MLYLILINNIVSSLYCFTNTNFDYYSGYKYEIYENEYSEFVKPLIEEEKIVIGVYLQVFKDSKIGLFFYY